MAESEDKKQEDVSQNSSHSHIGSVTLKTWVRTFSSLRRKNKTKETEGPSNINTSSESPYSTKIQDCKFPKGYNQKNKRKSIQEESKSKDDTPERTFIFNIPSKPLSVLQIDELFKSDLCLEDAYLNLLSLRLEFQREREALGKKDPPAELINKEKDLSLLYQTLRKKLTDIVRHSCDLTSKELLISMAFIIQEEEKREGELGGMVGWRSAWIAAVHEGMRDTLREVHLDSHEQNHSWLAVHLGLLGKAIVDSLEKVKTELVSSYSSNFNVFETYVSSCHEVVGEHLKELLAKVSELKDYYAMLDFIINIYQSDKILGSPSLQPEMKEQMPLKLPDAFLDQIQNEYCNCLQENLCTSLDNIIKLEQKDVWKKKGSPQKTEDGKFLTTHIHMNICTMIATYTQNSEKIGGNLKNRVLRRCLEGLKHFPKRFVKEFTENSSSLLGLDLLDCCLWGEYHTAYINSFSSLKEHMESYTGSCPDEVKQLGTEVDGLVLHLREALLQQFSVEIEPFMENLMTKTWLNTNDDFEEIINRIETYSGYSKSMKPPSTQFFANDVHYHVVKHYISQLLKNKYSCKGKKNNLAAGKIRDQWDELRNLFREMGSALNWLHPLGDQLSEIIQQENEKDIKKLLPPLIENYPDISKKQFSAILNFRDSGRSIEKYQVNQRFMELKRNSADAGNHEHILFSDIK